MNIIHLLYMDKPNGLENINKLYEKVSYFDNYGSSVIMLIFITIILLIVISYCYTMINVKPIIDDWPNQRCKPQNIPIAGFITHPEGMSAVDYTAQNFAFCTQNILSSITGNALQPLTFATSIIQNLMQTILNSLNAIRAMFDKVRTFFQSITQEIMGRLANIMVPLQQIIIGVKDFIGKIQGAVTAGLFTVLGSYYALQSFLGSIAQLIIIILIYLAVTIAVLLVIPFFSAAAGPLIAIFLAISVPLAIILVYFHNVLNINSPKMPRIGKCFHPNTKIKLKNGNVVQIKNINLGDIIENGSVVEATMKIDNTNNEKYEDLYVIRNSGVDKEDIYVTGSHLINNCGVYIPVKDYKDAVKSNLKTDVLFCLITSDHKIHIGSKTFWDWEDHFLKFKI